MRVAIPTCRYVIADLPVTRTSSCARQGPRMRGGPSITVGSSSFSRPTSSTEGTSSSTGRRRAAEALEPTTLFGRARALARRSVDPDPRPHRIERLPESVGQVPEYPCRNWVVHFHRGQLEAAVEPSRCPKLSLQSSIGPLQTDRRVARHDPLRLRLSPHPAGVTSQGDRRGGKGDSGDAENDMTHDGSPSCPLRPPVGRFDQETPVG